MRYHVVDPATGNQDFEAEANAPRLAAQHWEACQRTWRVCAEGEQERYLVVISGTGFKTPVPIRRMGL